MIVEQSTKRKRTGKNFDRSMMEEGLNTNFHIGIHMLDWEKPLQSKCKGKQSFWLYLGNVSFVFLLHWCN
jgi:hypothetical protein